MRCACIVLNGKAEQKWLSSVRSNGKEYENQQAAKQFDTQSANPFREQQHVPVLSLSKGRYEEFHRNDTLVKVGSAMYNTHTKRIAGIVERDVRISEATLEPEVASRWMSPDPLAAKFPYVSPYNYVLNNPVKLFDPDGREPCCPGGGNVADDQVLRYYYYQAVAAGKNLSSIVAGMIGTPAGLGVLRTETSVVADANGNVSTQTSDYFYQSTLKATGFGALEGLSVFTRSGPTALMAKTPAKSEMVNQVKNAVGITLKNTDPQALSLPESIKVIEGKVNITNRAVTNGNFDFVVTNEGRLVVGRGHYNLSEGAETVQAAGTMKIYNGKVTTVTNQSGHYQPTPAEAANYQETLKNLGIDLSNTKFKTVQ